jgi:tight adherence protein B
MERLRAELALGAPTRDALAGLRRRVDSPRVDAFAAALLSQQLAGGDLATLLRRFAAAAADRERTEADARSATAQARFTGMLVVAMPVGAALLAELLAPGFVGGLLADSAAASLLAIAAALQLAGFFAIKRLGRIGEP